MSGTLYAAAINSAAHTYHPRGEGGIIDGWGGGSVKIKKPAEAGHKFAMNDSYTAMDITDSKRGSRSSFSLTAGQTMHMDTNLFGLRAMPGSSNGKAISYLALPPAAFACLCKGQR